MKISILSWNVNGLRSVIRKNALDAIWSGPDGLPDIICLQETRCPEDTKIPDLPSSYKYQLIVPSSKPGYSGVGLFSKFAPNSIIDTELEDGRCICAEFNAFYLINLYVPNSKPDLSALPYRTVVWEPKVRALIQKLTKSKPVIVLGDFNVAPDENDIYMKKKDTTHGATPSERNHFQKLLSDCDLIDTYRFLNPNKREWTWFSNFGNARALNHGWRIDMALITSKYIKKIVESKILSHIPGSDHIPILIKVKQ